jgi:hypothetical protein
MSPWRLVSTDKLIQGSEEAKDDELLQTLRGDVTPQLEMESSVPPLS